MSWFPNEQELSAALAKTEFSSLVNSGRKWCYTAIESGYLRLAVVVENYPQYFVLDFDVSFPGARYIATEKNKQLGINDTEEINIITSSMVEARRQRKI
jgi:hypothetical protein